MLLLLGWILCSRIERKIHGKLGNLLTYEALWIISNILIWTFQLNCDARVSTKSIFCWIFRFGAQKASVYFRAWVLEFNHANKLRGALERFLYACLNWGHFGYFAGRVGIGHLVVFMKGLAQGLGSYLIFLASHFLVIDGI